MQLVGHQTESIYRRYAIVTENDLRDGTAKVAALDIYQDEERTKVLPMRSGTE